LALGESTGVSVGLKAALVLKARNRYSRKPGDQLIASLKQEILAGVDVHRALGRPAAVDLPVPHRKRYYGTNPDDHRVDQHRKS
jgi:hypothetical protein